MDKKEYQYVRSRDGFCIAGRYLRNGCTEGVDVHHIKTRGSGGDDVRENMICLCRKHHEDAHWGRITKDQLKKWLEERYGYEYQDWAG